MFNSRLSCASLIAPQDQGEDFEIYENYLRNRRVKIFLRTSAIHGSIPTTRHYYQVESAKAWTGLGAGGGTSFRTSSGRLAFFKLFKCKDNDQRAYNGLRAKNAWTRIIVRPAEPNVKYEVQFLDDKGDWWFSDQSYPRKPRTPSPEVSPGTSSRSSTESLQSSRPASLASSQALDYLAEALTPSPVAQSRIKQEFLETDLLNTSASILIDSSDSVSNSSIPAVGLHVSTESLQSVLENPGPTLGPASPQMAQATFSADQLRLMQGLLNTMQQPAAEATTQVPANPDPVALSRQTELAPGVINDPRIMQMSTIIIRMKNLEESILHNVLLRDAGIHSFKIAARPIQSPSLDLFNHDVADQLNHILTEAARQGSDVILKAQMDSYQELISERDRLADGWDRTEADNRAITALIARRKPVVKPPPVPVEDKDAPTRFYLPPSTENNRITVNPVVAAQGTTGNRIPRTRSRSTARGQRQGRQARSRSRPTRSASRHRGPAPTTFPGRTEEERNAARIQAANQGCIAGYVPPRRR